MLFHNTEKTETRHENATKVYFISRTTTVKLLTEAGLLQVTGFASVSQFANHCQISRCIISFVTHESTNGTSQDDVLNINDPCWF